MQGPQAGPQRKSRKADDGWSRESPRKRTKHSLCRESELGYQPFKGGLQSKRGFDSKVRIGGDAYSTLTPFPLGPPSIRLSATVQMETSHGAGQSLFFSGTCSHLTAGVCCLLPGMSFCPLYPQSWASVSMLCESSLPRAYESKGRALRGLHPQQHIPKNNPWKHNGIEKCQHPLVSPLTCLAGAFEVKRLWRKLILLVKTK